jgi:hypothetical protein
MKKGASVMAAVAAMVLWTTAASAQGFAGKWAPDAEKNAAANPAMQGGGGGGGGGGGRGGFGGGPMTIAITGDAMTVTRTTPNGDMETKYTLDDKEQTITMGQGEAKVKAKWESNKSKIVVETTRDRNGTAFTSKAVYSIDGDNLVIETTSPGRDGTPMTRKQFYKKAA